METQRPPLSAREAMRSYRARMKERGMRSIQIWVPDTRTQEIADEMRRQSLLVSQGQEESDVLEFLENVSAWPTKSCARSTDPWRSGWACKNFSPIPKVFQNPADYTGVPINL